MTKFLSRNLRCSIEITHDKSRWVSLTLENVPLSTKNGICRDRWGTLECLLNRTKTELQNVSCFTPIYGMFIKKTPFVFGTLGPYLKTIQTLICIYPVKWTQSNLTLI
eukprot:TRINITY_DN6032_c1_g1_i1.p1 TRINITY_DN6032_c1_g1~~TRINITY_DN6032_c1_g1_i1.p1  ORF type:complete len:108 (-),score=1.81 TRINITY_DN6032_c1_g1_i1:278-601(-)